MKKVLSLFLCLSLCLSITAGCTPAVQEVAAVQISVGELTPGMTFDSVLVEVVINGEPVRCETEWVVYYTDGYDYLSPSDTIPEDFYGRLDVRYFLPKGVDPGDIDVALNAPGGTYEGTGEGTSADTGEMEAWSHIQYGTEPVEQTQPAPTEPLQADVSIHIGELTPGAAFSSVPIEVTVNGKTVEYALDWVIYYTDGYDYLSPSDTIPEDYYGRLDLRYFLPKGVDPGDIEVTLDAPGGTYEGTGEGNSADTGEIEAWSHIQYGTEPAVPETTAPAAPQPETPAPTNPPQPEPTEHEHNWVKDEALSQAPTCYEEGWNHIACTDCDQSYREHIPSYEHSWNTGAPTVTQAPTCTESGSQMIPCSNCVSTYTETIPALGHDFALHTFVSGSCPTGVTWDKVCSRCGGSEAYTTDPTDHSWGIFTYINNRAHEMVCSICGDVTTASHTFAPGDTSGQCTGCGEYIIN